MYSNKYMKPKNVTGKYADGFYQITPERYESFMKRLKEGQFRRVPILTVCDDRSREIVHDVRVVKKYPHICVVEYYNKRARRMVTTTVQNKAIMICDEQEKREKIIKALEEMHTQDRLADQRGVRKKGVGKWA